MCFGRPEEADCVVPSIFPLYVVEVENAFSLLVILRDRVGVTVPVSAAMALGVRLFPANICIFIRTQLSSVDLVSVGVGYRLITASGYVIFVWDIQKFKYASTPTF